jgi:hypothetical protein
VANIVLDKELDLDVDEEGEAREDILSKEETEALRRATAGKRVKVHIRVEVVE